MSDPKYPTDKAVSEVIIEDDEVNESASNRPQEKTTAGASLVARFGLMKSIGRFSHTLETPPKPEAKVVIRTNRGVELGEVVASICEDGCQRCISKDKLDEFLKSSGPDYPFITGGKLLRIANRQDIIDASHLEGQAKEEGTFCRKEIRQANLAMRIITVEHLLGGERIIFYFSSDSRVDFRELVRKLASQYRTRIEMRQVGARDEARLVADYERCGRQCCCQGFLKHLKPVSMRMAKVQKATLDPTKISGRCGRLMCCLRFEDGSYTELKKLLPRRNTWVRTADAIGKVIDGQILTQLVRLYVPGGQVLVVSVEDIIEHDLPEPTAQELQDQRLRPPRRESFDPEEEKSARTEQAPADEAETPAPASPDKTRTDAPKKKRRRRRRPKKQDSQSQGSQGQGAEKPQKSDQPDKGSPQVTGEKSTSTKRRQRRRRKKS